MANPFIQVLGTDPLSVAPQLWIGHNEDRFLVNAGENTQRIALEYRLRLSKVGDIFVTSLSPFTISGLSGLLLTLEMGDSLSPDGIDGNKPVVVSNVWTKVDFPITSGIKASLKIDSKEYYAFVERCDAFQRDISEITPEKSAMRCVRVWGPPGLFNILRAAISQFAYLRHLNLTIIEIQHHLHLHGWTEPIALPLREKSVKKQRKNAIGEVDGRMTFRFGLVSSEETVYSATSSKVDVASSRIGGSAEPQSKRRRTDQDIGTSYGCVPCDNENHQTASASGVVDKRQTGSVLADTLSEVGYTEVQSNGNYSLMIFASTPSMPGALDAAKALQLGVPRGPALGLLKNGQDVTLSDGTLIKSSDVVSPSTKPCLFTIGRLSNDYQGPASTISGDYLGHFLVQSFEDSRRHDAPPTAETVLNTADKLTLWMRKQGASVNWSPRCFACLPINEDMILRTQKLTSNLIFKASTSLENFRRACIMSPDEAAMTLSSGVPKSSHVGTNGVLNAADNDAREQKGSTERSSLHEMSPLDKVFFSRNNTVSIETADVQSEKAALEFDKVESDVKSLISEAQAIFESVGFGKQNLTDDLEIRPINIVFLGTGSAMPCKLRNVTGIFLEFGNDRQLGLSVMFDCGEGSLSQLRRYSDSYELFLKRLQHLQLITISHLHADHHLGLPGLLLYRRRIFPDLDPPVVYAPRGLRFWLEKWRALYTAQSSQSDDNYYHFIPADKAIDLEFFLEPPLSEDNQIGARFLEVRNRLSADAMSHLAACLKLTCDSAPVAHMGSGSNGQPNISDGCYGVRLSVPRYTTCEEKFVGSRAEKTITSNPIYGRVVKVYDSSEDYGGKPNDEVIENPLLHGLEKSSRKESGEESKEKSAAGSEGQPTIEARAGHRKEEKRRHPQWRICFSGDTRPCETLIGLAKDADVLIHEGTFEGDALEEAKRKNHSTIEEAMNVAHAANVDLLLITHFSQRYPTSPQFPETHALLDKAALVYDGLKIPVAQLLNTSFKTATSRVNAFAKGMRLMTEVLRTFKNGG